MSALCLHFLTALVATHVDSACGRALRLPDSSLDRKAACDALASVAASSRGLFLASLPALRAPEAARRSFGFECSVRDTRAAVACGVDVDAEASSTVFSFV